MILNRFPVFIGTPQQKRFDDKERAMKYINQQNGLTDVYVSLYNDGVIDKVVWDFDYDPESKAQYHDWSRLLEDFRKLTYTLRDEGYKQMSVFSGNGIHKYLKTEVVELEKPKQAIREVQEKYQRELDINSDEAVFGDIRRIFRVPNTYNPGAGRFCVPLKPEDVEKDIDELKSLSQEQRFPENTIEGEKEYKIGKHDSKSSWKGNPMENKVEGDFDFDGEGAIFPIYPCMANLLKNREEIEDEGHGLGYRRRFLIILHLKETGHTIDETKNILEEYLSDDEFFHCVYEESQVEQIYKRKDLLFPRCNKLMQEVPCCHEPENDSPCEMKDSIYE